MPQFRYLIVDEDGDVTGTNDAELATAIADAKMEYTTVIDTVDSIGNGIPIQETSMTLKQFEEPCAGS